MEILLFFYFSRKGLTLTTTFTLYSDILVFSIFIYKFYNNYRKYFNFVIHKRYSYQYSQTGYFKYKGSHSEVSVSQTISLCHWDLLMFFIFDSFSTYENNRTLL